MTSLITWAKAHPRLSAWIVLGAGMVAIIVYEARDVGLLWGQWIALVVATVAVAGLCVWIISWEDDEPAESLATSEGAPNAGSEGETAESAPTTKSD